MRQPHLLKYEQAFVADDATIVGDVRLGAEASIWYGVVVRADVAPISIGPRTNVQDRCVVHPEHDEDIAIGAEVTIGHGALIHGRTIGDHCLIGMGAILLPGSHVGPGSLVAAGALIPPRMEVPARSLVMGSPGRIVRRVTDQELEHIADTVRRYLSLTREHLR
jgi:carbonic anhydrase/acetyltransferase-like protein (isoleucine patch superfamily)